VLPRLPPKWLGSSPLASELALFSLIATSRPCTIDERRGAHQLLPLVHDLAGVVAAEVPELPEPIVQVVEHLEASGGDPGRHRFDGRLQVERDRHQVHALVGDRVGDALGFLLVGRLPAGP
jgi:hypothetical protein